DYYGRLEEEKARRHGKVYNWETAKYGKILYDEDVHDLRSVETEFPAIVFNDKLTSEEALPCEPTVVMAGVPKAAEDASVVDEGDQTASAPRQVPQPPLAARNIPQRMDRLEKDVNEIQVALGEQRKVMDAMSKDFSRFIIDVGLDRGPTVPTPP
nr:hypothetical protein [Tanacetum cinerariifolium]